MPAFLPLPRLSSLLLATSLLLTGACSSATRTAADAGTTGPIHTVRVEPREPDVDRAALRAELKQRRDASVARFLAYREAKVYPINSYTPGLQHVWIDELGHLCAAATVISADWGFDVTAAVAIEDNFVRLADVTDGPLAEWMLTSGLTHHEIVAIQEPMEGPDGRFGMMAPDPQPDPAEQARLYAIYVSVERQLASLEDENLDLAVAALAAHPDLARRFLAGELPGPGKYASS